MNVRSGTGLSSAVDAFAAGRAAANAAIGRLAGEAPALVFVFASPRHDLDRLLDGVRSVTGAAPLIGVSGSGEIMRDTYLAFGMGVGVMVLSAGANRYGVASASNVRGHLAESGQSIADHARQAAGPGRYGAVVVLADCLAGDLRQMFDGVCRVAGPRVPIIGGAAGDELQFVASFVFHDDKVVEKGAVALWISSDDPIEAITGHDWEPIGVPLFVARAENGTDRSDQETDQQPWPRPAGISQARSMNSSTVAAVQVNWPPPQAVPSMGS